MAARLRAMTEVNSISAEDTFGLQADILEYLADMEQSAEGLGIHKVYASYAAMVADAPAPVGSNGKALRYGQLVSIYDESNPSQSESGNVYAWQKGNTGASAWLLMGNLGDIINTMSTLKYVVDTFCPSIIEDKEVDLSIADGQGNTIVQLNGGHIRTKNFDSEQVATKHEIPDVSDFAATDDGQHDLSIVDEHGNAVVVFSDGHVKTKEFDSSTPTPKTNDSTIDGDLNISDEQGYAIVRFKNGHIKTKNFDSENVLSSANIEYPQFMGYGIDDTSGEETASLVHLTSMWVRASKGDTVQVKDATKIGGFKVYEYKSVKGQLLAKSSSFSTGEYTVQNVYTAFIRIEVVFDGTTTLYTNKDARGNVYVTHNAPILSADDKLQLNSTIPEGWYVSEQSEFPKVHVKKGGYWNQYGTQESDNVIPLTGENNVTVDGETVTVDGIYDHYDELYQKYGPNGTDPIGKGYITREVLGQDASNTYDIYRYVFEPRNVDVVAQKEYTKNNVTTGYDYGKSRGVINDSLPKICIESCLHGAEKPSARALLNFIIHLCENWKTNKFLEWLRWNVKLVVIPIANPYGYVNNTRKNANLVDLNRNFNGNGGWAQFADNGTAAGDYKGTAPYSEVETRLIARNMLEHADAIAYFDLHAHGSYTGLKVMTRFDYGNDEFLGNMLSSVGQEVTKGFTMSGILHHGMDTPSIYETNGFEYFGQVGCSAGNVPYISNQGVEIGLPAASPEVTYLRQYFDKAQYFASAAYNDTCYTNPTDCMNEEYVANLILCTLRQRFIQRKK